MPEDEKKDETTEEAKPSKEESAERSGEGAAAQTDSGPDPGHEAEPSDPYSMVEPDGIPVLKATIVLVGLSVIVVVSSLVVVGLFELVTQDIVESQNSLAEDGSPAVQLQALRARDEARLTGYELLDEERGLYQIPIERAIDLLVAEPNSYLPGVGGSTRDVPPPLAPPVAPPLAPSVPQGSGTGAALVPTPEGTGEPVEGGTAP
jgi:hypothetical protein